MKWAIRTRYLESPHTGDGKWHQRTTKWYNDLADAWEEADAYSNTHGKNWYESSSSCIHKEA